MTLAPTSLSSTAIRADHIDLVKLLLQWGSQVNQQGCHGRRPIHEASRLGRVELVSLLLEAGAQPDPRSHYGLTPLALAAQAGHLVVAEMLLKKGETTYCTRTCLGLLFSLFQSYFWFLTRDIFQKLQKNCLIFPHWNAKLQ